MRREIMGRLRQWKDRKGRKPLIPCGAPQVGKTWAARQFGKECFAQTAWFNFKENRHLRSLFSSGIDIGRILLGLRIESGIDVAMGDVLVVFDEVDEDPLALLSLKRFYESAPQIPIIATRSLTGLSLQSSATFPEDQVELMPMRPLSFSEFLLALGNDDLQKLIASRDWPLISAMEQAIIDLLRIYLFVGGMPEAVSAFCNGMDFNAARKAQVRLLDSYAGEIKKRLWNVADAHRALMVWQSIPSQLSKENKKLFYSRMERGGRCKDYAAAIDLLAGAGLVHKMSCVGKPDLPPAGSEGAPFKLYGLDAGLLCAQLSLDPRVLLEGNRIFNEFNGALAQQFVLQELVAAGAERIFYWTSGSGSAVIDFLVQH